MFSIGVYLRVAASLGIFILVWFLFAMFRRESVKRDLRQRGCKPIRIWWMVTAWWSPSLDGMPFRVTYSDSNHLIHKASCWVGHRLMDSPLGARRVIWVRDEIIGEMPLPEVSADGGIDRRQLKDNNLTSSE
jgi:hypothetical protein